MDSSWIRPARIGWFFLFVAPLAWMGCGSLPSMLQTNWSENYALAANGATASAEGLTDGKLTTIAETPRKADPREFLIEFPDVRRVRRIRIANYNLYRFNLAYWNLKRQEWDTIKTVWQRRDVDSFERSIVPFFDFTHINFETNKVKITVTRTVEDVIVNKVAPSPDDKILEHVQRDMGGTWVEYWRIIVESPARIRDVEIYGVLPKEAKQE